MQQQTIYDKLQNLVRIADETLRDRRLHQRVRSLSNIDDKREQVSESTRHNSVRYDLENFNYSVEYYLRTLNHSDELLRIFDYIEIAYHDRSAANLLELKMVSLQKVISEIELRPQRYIDQSIKYSSNVEYDKQIGLLTQSDKKPYQLKDKGRALVGYLWGKRRQMFSDRSPTRQGRPVSMSSAMHNVGITDDKLADVINNFNAMASERRIDAKIRREKGNVILEVQDEFPTRK